MKGDTMKHDYLHNQAAENLALGFIYNGLVYMKVTFSAGWALQFAKYDKTSKSHGRQACLRFKPTAIHKEYIVKHFNPQVLCTVEELDDEIMQGENRGHAFERLAREALGGWTCTPRGWWDGVDFVAKGEGYQAKFEGGTFCTAKQCREHRTR